MVVLCKPETSCGPHLQHLWTATHLLHQCAEALDLTPVVDERTISCAARTARRDARPSRMATPRTAVTDATADMTLGAVTEHNICFAPLS